MNATAIPVANISGYLFAHLDDLKNLRTHLLAECKQRHLKGTILLSKEGINCFLAGPQPAIEEVILIIQSIPGLETFRAKFSDSDHQPFNRMLVRIKKEIISFGVDGVNPARYTSRHLPAATLKQWLDEGRDIVLLDTRNDYEIRTGSFKNAIPIGIDSFRAYPEAVAKLPEQLKEKTIVTFCTGGIRCEKAAPFMEMVGYKDIYQLDGGILKYFEEVGGAHYDGECFVFDQRVGVDPSLRETTTAVCFHCQTPLDEEDQSDPRYVVGISCPYCYESDEEKYRKLIEQRHADLARLTQPLPGSIPMENIRPLNIKAPFDGRELLSILLEIFPHIEESEWQQRLDEGRFRDQHGKVVAANHIVRAGERYKQTMAIASEPDVNADIRILHEDEALIVVRKPAPLPMHPSGRFHRNTLQSIMNQVYRPAARPVHRLDANTAGLVIYAKTRHFCSTMQRQLLDGTMEKTYLTRVQGHPQWDRHTCQVSLSDVASVAGSREIDEENGLPCHTDFDVLQRDADGTSLLEARLHTGRTHQIRLHLWHLGFPVCGDATYLADHQVAATQTLPTNAPPMLLHAWKLRCLHPVRGETLTFEDHLPSWAIVM